MNGNYEQQPTLRLISRLPMFNAQGDQKRAVTLPFYLHTSPITDKKLLVNFLLTAFINNKSNR